MYRKASRALFCRRDRRAAFSGTPQPQTTKGVKLFARHPEKGLPGTEPPARRDRARRVDDHRQAVRRALQNPAGQYPGRGRDGVLLHLLFDFHDDLFLLDRRAPGRHRQDGRRAVGAGEGPGYPQAPPAVGKALSDPRDCRDGTDPPLQPALCKPRQQRRGLALGHRDRAGRLFRLHDQRLPRLLRGDAQHVPDRRFPGGRGGRQTAGGPGAGAHRRPGRRGPVCRRRDGLRAGLRHPAGGKRRHPAGRLRRRHPRRHHFDDGRAPSTSSGNTGGRGTASRRRTSATPPGRCGEGC